MWYVLYKAVINITSYKQCAALTQSVSSMLVWCSNDNHVPFVIIRLETSFTVFFSRGGQVLDLLR